MIKVNPLIYVASAISLIFFLLSPYKLLQFVCLSVLFVLLISFFYALVLSRTIKIERSTDKLKLACKEKSEISFINPTSVIPPITKNNPSNNNTVL